MPLRIATSKPGVLWQGAFFVHHSLALVNRELALALLETNRLEIGIRHVETPVFGPEDDPRFAALAARMQAHPERPSITVRHFWPPDFRRPDTSRLVVIQPWEFGSLPRAWIAPITESVDEVWVPTRFVRECYLASGVPGEKVFVVPNGVNTARFHPHATPLPLPTKKGYKFLFVGGTISRKGIDVLLDAYTRAFTDRDDVSLIVKDFGTGSFYAGQGVGALIAALQARPGTPEIIHLTQDMTEADVAGLYAACDCLAHPYRGEGYGLPIAEAMACGKPTIATGFGAALDFATPETCYLLPATLARMREKRIGDLETVDYPYWAEPDREALAATLRRVYERPEEARVVGARAAAHIAAGHTWAHAARAAADRLETLSRTDASRRAGAAVPVTVKTLERRKEEALAQASRGEWKEAAAEIAACYREDPADWALLNVLGVAYHHLGEKRKAEETLREGIVRVPQTVVFHTNLIAILLEEGHAADALEAACAAWKSLPEAPEVRDALARARAASLREARRIRKRGGKRDEAYRALTAAVARADRLLTGASEPGSPHPESRILKPESCSSPPRLSVVMIVKDEEKFLRDCLESVREVADEIVVVDTGSTDGSIAIAEAFGAKVVCHEWQDDFSAARNVSLDHATGDWALWIDADERLARGDGPALRALIGQTEPHIGGYMVNIRNFMQLREDADVCWHRACRLFRVVPNARFTGRIHEQNARGLQDAGYTLAVSALILDHLGYAASVMEERDKHARFIRMLTREVEENPDDRFRTFHRFNLANAYYTQGDMEKAVLWFEKAAEAPETGEEYTAMLFTEWATALYSLGREEETLQVCDRAEEIGIRYAGLHFARGHATLRLRDYEAAERHFRNALATGGNGPVADVGDSGTFTYKAHYGLALAAMGRDQLEACTGHCREALAGRDNFADARYLLATTLRRLGRPAEARRELEQVLEAAPEFADARANLAGLLFDMDDYTAALPLLRRAVEEKPGVCDLWTRLGSCCERLALWREARDAYQAAQQLVPGSPEVRVNLGRVLAALGEDAAAIDCFADAIALDPNYTNAYFNAADTLYRLEHYAKAAELLCAGLEHDPAHAPGMFVLGNCCFQLGDYAAACRTYRAALALRPDYPEARSNLAMAEQNLAA